MIFIPSHPDVTMPDPLSVCVKMTGLRKRCTNGSSSLLSHHYPPTHTHTHTLLPLQQQQQQQLIISHIQLFVKMTGKS